MSSIIKPLEAAQGQLEQVRKGQVDSKSFARCCFNNDVEQGLNDALALELNVAHIYLSMSAYFDKDVIALPGISGYFRSKAMQRFGDGDKVAHEVNRRGGRVQLQAVPPSYIDLASEGSGDAVCAYENALALERLKFERYSELHERAEKGKDVQSADFLEDMLSALAKEIKELANYTSELHRGQNPHSVFTFDERLQDQGNFGGTLSAS